MQSQAHAEASAPSSRISTQGSGPSTPPEQPINRNPVEQGNTSAEKSLNTSLPYDKKVRIIRAAIEKQHGGRMKDWGSLDLSRLINHHEKEGSSPNQWRTFFTDLLFFVARPDISAAFSKALPDGLLNIRKQLDFFEELSIDYDDYLAWCDYMYVPYEEVISEWDFTNIAHSYLEADDLVKVLGTAKLRSAFVEVKKSFEFENDRDLVAALDRYFPDDKWPAGKLEIASQPEMKARLEGLEARRIQQENETAEERKAREIRSAVNGRLIMGPNFLGMTGDPEYDVRTNTRKPAPVKPLAATIPPVKKPGSAVKPAAGAVNGRSSAVAPKKVTPSVKKPAGKPSTTKKKA